MERRDYDRLTAEAGNFRSMLTAQATGHADARSEDHLAGQLLLLERRIYWAMSEYSIAALAILPKEGDAAGSAPAEPAAAKHRHDFGDGTLCLVVVNGKVCGKPKARNGRKPDQTAVRMQGGRLLAPMANVVCKL